MSHIPKALMDYWPADCRFAVVWCMDGRSCASLFDHYPDLDTLLLIETQQTPQKPPHDHRIQVIHTSEAAVAVQLEQAFHAFEWQFTENRIGLWIEPFLKMKYPSIAEAIYHTTLQTSKWHATCAVFRATKGWHLLNNALFNARRMSSHSSLTCLKNAAGNSPVIIVGAGPSLDKDVEWISTAASSCWIIACDAAWNALIKADIRPDLVVTTDGVEWTSQHVMQGIKCQPNVPLVVVPESSWTIVRHYPGPIYFTRQDHWLDDQLRKHTGVDCPSMYTGQCVGHAVFWLAEYLHAAGIIMAGFDLGYAHDHYYPASRAVVDTAIKQDSDSDCLWVDGNEGDPIRTDYSLFFYLRQFEYMIAETSIPVWNATDHGARIRGTQRGLPSLDAFPPAKKTTAPRPVQCAPDGVTRFYAAIRETYRLFLHHMKITKEQTDWMMRHDEPPFMSGAPWTLVEPMLNPITIATFRLDYKAWQSGRLGIDALQQSLHLLLLDMQQRTSLIEPALDLIERPVAERKGIIAYVPSDAPECVKTYIYHLSNRYDIETIDQWDGHFATLWPRLASKQLFIMYGGSVFPAGWAIPGCACLDIYDAAPDDDTFYGHWILGYHILTTNPELKTPWMQRVRGLVPVFDMEETVDLHTLKCDGL